MPPGLSHLLDPGNTASGVANHFFFAPVSWFETIQCPLPDGIVIPSEHEFIIAKDWIKVIVSPSTGEVTASSIGEQGSKKFIKKYKGFVPGTKETLHASMAGLINEAIILLVPDSDCPSGYRYQLGCDCVFAYCESAEFTTGTLKDGKKGYQVEFTYPTEKINIYPTCENITPTFNWSFNDNGAGDAIMIVADTTVYPPGVTMLTKSFTIFDQNGNEVTTAPFINSYLHDYTAPFLWDQALSPMGGAYYWIITMTITTSNGCVKTARAQLDGTTVIWNTIEFNNPHNGTND